jgi:hypothetical protein
MTALHYTESSQHPPGGWPDGTAGYPGLRGLVNIFNTNYIYYMAALLVKDVPDELRNLFKAICAEEGKTMRQGIIQLMRGAVERKRKTGRVKILDGGGG